MIAGLAPPLTEQAEDIERVWNGFTIAAFGVGLLVAVLLTIVLVRFRRRRGDVDTTLPRQVYEHVPLELSYTIVPLLIVAVLFAVTFVSVNAVDEAEADVELVVEVVGLQWQWQFDYPEAGVSVTGTDATTPELVLPADTAVRFDLRSVDVIHSFWIPGFRFKRDMFPGQETSFSVDVGSRTGSFPNTGVCAEFCGLDHTTMRFSVRIVTPDEFERWLQDEEAS
jgi:cytochrome c oxidase subunit II